MPSISYEDQKKEATEQIVHEFKKKEARRIVGLSYWSEAILWQESDNVFPELQKSKSKITD